MSAAILRVTGAPWPDFTQLGRTDEFPAMGPLAPCIGIFWAVRVGVQVFYYDQAHWLGKCPETIIHFALLFLYASMSVTYLMV